MNRKALVLVIAHLALLAIRSLAEDANEPGGTVVQATFNGTQFVLDRATGGMLRMAHPGPGTMLDATAASAGGIEVLVAAADAKPARLASRFAPRARIGRQDDRIVIDWPRLGGEDERGDPGAGHVAATVTLEAAEDGRSVLLACRLENHLGRTLRQVRFPDLRGLVPWGGAERMAFRTGSQLVRPFVDLPAAAAAGGSRGSRAAAFHSGGVNSREMIIRWFDLGTLRGGLSVFPRRWGNDPRATVLLARETGAAKLRLSAVHDVTIPSGGSWSSGTYVLTPHASGWAKGIEPYRQWVRGKLADRVYALPEHIRSDIGFRTVWLCRNQPKDPRDAAVRTSPEPIPYLDGRRHACGRLCSDRSVRGCGRRGVCKAQRGVGVCAEHGRPGAVDHASVRFFAVAAAGCERLSAPPLRRAGTPGGVGGAVRERSSRDGRAARTSRHRNFFGEPLGTVRRSPRPPRNASNGRDTGQLTQVL